MGNDVENIVDGLQHLRMPLSDLVLDPRNARAHNERNLSTIKASLSRFGQRLPLVVQRDGMVVRAGNGRVTAMRALGWTHAAAVVVDEADADAIAFALADNRTAELAEWDHGALADLVAELTDAGLGDLDLADLGWDASDLDGLALATAWDDFDNDEARKGRNVPTGGVAVRFTEAQADRLGVLLTGDKLDPEAIVALCEKGAAC